MAAGVHNFTIEQGTSVNKKIIWKDNSTPAVPVDLTGYTARMMVRSTIVDPTALLTLTTENAGITVGTTNGTITLVMTATATAPLTWVTGVYDLELVSTTGIVTRLLKGTITVDPEVTRP